MFSILYLLYLSVLIRIITVIFFANIHYIFYVGFKFSKNFIFTEIIPAILLMVIVKESNILLVTPSF